MKGIISWFILKHKLGNKTQLGSGHTVRPSMGLGGSGSKTFEKITIFSLKIGWYSLLKMINLKLSVSNENKNKKKKKKKCYYNINNALLCLFSVLLKVKREANLNSVKY